MRRVIWLQTPTVFWVHRGAISLSYWMFVGLIMLDKQKYIQQGWILQSRNDTKHQVPIKFQQNWLKQWAGQFALRSINLSIHKKELKRGRSRNLYLYIRRDIKQIVELQRHRHISFVTYVHYFIQHPPVKVNSVCRRNYCGSSVWIAKQQVK